jgi:phage shock protein PspC (stress-responsive transcriptional regulator)
MSQTTPPAPESPEYFDPARLRTVLQARRSQEDRMLAGVCGGVGSYLGIDPVLLRVGFALLTIFGGLGAVAYFALWLLLPEEGSDMSIASQRSGKPDAELRTVVLVIAALLAVGVLGSSAWFLPFHIPWPIFIAVGCWWFFSQRRRRYRGGWMERGASPHNPQAPGCQAGSYHETDPSTASPEPTSASGDRLSESSVVSTSPVDWSQPDPLGLYAPPTTSSVPPAPPRPRSLFWPTIGVALIAVGALALIDAIHGGVAPVAYPLLALGVVGLGLILGSVGARSRGLIPVGALLAVGVVLASIAPDPRFGQIMATPRTGGDIQSSYELTAGEVNLDLTQIDDMQDLDRSITVKVLTGQIKVIVPAGVDVTVESHATAGDLKILGRQANGTDSELVVAPDDPTDAAPDLVLDLRVGLGEVDVSQP